MVVNQSISQAVHYGTFLWVSLPHPYRARTRPKNPHAHPAIQGPSTLGKYMLAEMAVRSAFIIVMVLVCLDGSYAAEVPSKFLGFWSSIARLEGDRYTMSLVVTGGSVNTTVGMVYTLWSRKTNCVQEIRFTNGEKGGAVETVTDETLFFNGACFPMRIRIAPSQADRIVVDWIRLDDDGDIIETVGTIMDRLDDGQLTKRMGTCEPKTGKSPLVKLKEKLNKDRKSKKQENKKRG